MPLIRPLPAHIVAKIAAGEVIERPASVVKELVENALDAQAKHIAITIDQAGLKRIRVTDDGCGMDQTDLLECFKPHTTSKLQDDDLLSIGTLGFRGEALSSIAAVSRLSLQSRVSSASTGYRIVVQNRVLAEHGPIGIPAGTQVEITELFAKVPVRKQFLSSHRTETYQITQLLTKIALSHPIVGFQLKHNCRTLIDLPADQSVSGRLQSLFGTTLTGNLLPIHFATDEITISGFVGAPHIATRSAKRQYFFVNTRLFRNTSISIAIKEAYGTLLDPHSQPAAFLFFYLPSNHIDVNIHPRKEEVKFLKRTALLAAVKQSVLQTLHSHHLVSRPFQAGHIAYSADETGLSTVQDSTAPFAGYGAIADLLKDRADLWSPRETSTEDTIVQAHNTYLILPSKRGIRIIDQHAAHERIHYETLLTLSRASLQNKKNYCFPTTQLLELPAAEASFFEQHLPTFVSLGFDIEPFGTNLFKLNTAPELLAHLPLNRMIADVIHLISEEKQPDLSQLLHRIIALLACRSAIKAGDPLTPIERKNLIDQLDRTTGKYTCPHGRPVEIEISLKELETLFRRR